VTALPRRLASAISPAIPAPSYRHRLRIALVVCGVLKIAYDLSLLISFRP
jgi:hypothetical protein